MEHNKTSLQGKNENGLTTLNDKIRNHFLHESAKFFNGLTRIYCVDLNLNMGEYKLNQTVVV